MSTLTSGPAETPSEARLRSVPWEYLRDLAPLIEPALRSLLDGKPAERVLDSLLRAHRDLTAPQRTVIAESLFGVGLWRRRLLAQLPEASPLELLSLLVADLGKAPQHAPTALSNRLAPPTAWRDRFSIPDWIAEHLEQRYPDTAPDLAAAFNHPGPVCLRARDGRDQLATELAHHGITTTPGRWASQALLVTTPRPNLYGLPPDLQHTFEVQDEGSQLLGLLVDPTPGTEVLDLCAGAGGKSLQLASRLGPQGRVHATDIDSGRLDRLRTRATKANANVVIHGALPPSDLRVPRVLVDAPCSELGTLRRGPDLRWRLDPASPSTWAPIQRQLVERGLTYLTPNGRLVYATCTLTRIENEDVVDAVLADHPELTLVSPPLVLAPHLHGTDGFFGAVFTRRSEASSTAK